MHAGTLWDVTKQAASEFMEDKAPRLGAALAYYTIFALAPTLVIIIGVVGLFYRDQPETAQAAITHQMEGLVGEQGGKAIESMVESASKPGNGILGSVLGIIMLLVGATGLFGQLQDALNTIWEVQPKPNRGIWGIVRDRFLSFTLVLGIAFLLLVSLVVSAALSALAGLFGEFGRSYLGLAINEGIGLVVITGLFAMIYKFLPDAKIAWRDVWLGAGVTAVLFVVGKFAIGEYIGQSGVVSAYGAAGSLAALLIWLYYSSQIFLYGAELTQVVANKYGSRIEPARHAERVPEIQRAEEGIPHTHDGNGQAPADKERAGRRG
jgi:membrane protein